MIIAYKPQSQNPDKHPQMAGEYYWEKYEINDDMVQTFQDQGYTILSEQQFSDAMTAVDLSAYNTATAPTQIEKDKAKYTKRANALNNIISDMAVDNVARVRAGVWTVDQLIGLTQDEMVKQIVNDLVSLSFEIAYSKVDYISLAYVTTEIKTAFKAKLYANFFNS